MSGVDLRRIHVTSITASGSTAAVVVLVPSVAAVVMMAAAAVTAAGWGMGGVQAGCLCCRVMLMHVALLADRRKLFLCNLFKNLNPKPSTNNRGAEISGAWAPYGASTEAGQHDLCCTRAIW